MALQWNDQYRIGHERIDCQHKHLFELINRLEAKIESGADRQDSLEAIQSLIDYVLVHFSDEESLMQEIEFGDINGHRWRHSEFAGKVADMALEWGQGHEVTLTQIRDFLAEWLLDHILIEDMQIGVEIRRKLAAGAQTS